MEFKKLVKNTSFLVSTKFVQFFAGMFRSKINAVILGTTGVGVFNQLAFVANRMYQMTILGMGEAVVKQIAGNGHKDQKEHAKIICQSLKSYIFLAFVFLLISSSLLLFFRDALTNYIFGDIQYKKYYFLGILTIPILIINSIPFSILKSFKDVKGIARARIVIILINLVLFIPFVLLYKLDGAAFFLPLSFVVTAVVNYRFAYRKYFKTYGIGWQEIFGIKMNRETTREILIFSGFGLIVALYGIFYEFFSRSLVVTHLGIEKIGIYSPIVKWFGLFTGFIMPSFSTYLFPRYSEVKSNEELSGIINDSLRMCTLMLLPLLLIAIPFRDFFIQLFYSKDFLEASLYLPFHFYGRVFFIWFFALVVSLKPTGKVKWHAFFYIILYTINTFLSYTLIPKYGLYGMVLSSTVGAFILFFLLWGFLKRKSDFRIQQENGILMIYMLIVVLLMIFIDFYFEKGDFNYVLGPLFLVMSFFMLTTNEKKFAVRQVNTVLKFIRK